MNMFILVFLLLSILFTIVHLWSKNHLLSIVISIAFMTILVYTGWKSYSPSFSFQDHISKILDKPVSYTSSFIENTIPMSSNSIKDEVLLDVPILKQLPELPRGCEVTSLAMMLQYKGIDVDKLTLARQIKKNPAKMQKVNGQVYYGDPNEGFIGDMYSFNKPGLGVYHTPIKELGERYMPGNIVDFTGKEFNTIKKYLSVGRPVWVIINTAYKKLDPSYFHIWQTPNGAISITYKEHSVVVTGYDKDYIYFNDPLTGIKNKKAPTADFEEAWVQMGRQAISYKN